MTVPAPRLRPFDAVHESAPVAIVALAKFRAREARALRDLARVDPVRRAGEVHRLRFEDPDAAVVELGMPEFPVELEAVRYLTPAGAVAELEQIDERACEDAAIRAQATAARTYGPRQLWAARVTKDGRTHQALFRGTLSELRALMPDDIARERLRQAGVRGLEDTATPIQVERRRRFPLPASASAVIEDQFAEELAGVDLGLEELGQALELLVIIPKAST